MLILVHTAHPQAVAHSGPGFGRLLAPRQFSRASDTAEASQTSGAGFNVSTGTALRLPS